MWCHAIVWQAEACRDMTWVHALYSRRADDRRRKRARERQEDEADRRAEAEEQLQRKDAGAASSGTAPDTLCVDLTGARAAQVAPEVIRSHSELKFFVRPRPRPHDLGKGAGKVLTV